MATGSGEHELSPHLFAHEDAAGRLFQVLAGGGRHGRAQRRPGATGPVTLAEAEQAYATSLGFPDWRALRLAVWRRGAAEKLPDSAYKRASAALHGGDAGALVAALEADAAAALDTPDGHSALLLQAVELREPELVARLLAAGARPGERAPCGCSAVHRAAYGHPPEVAGAQEPAAASLRHLLARDRAVAASTAHGAGGTPLAMAAFWGHAPLVDLVADAGPDNLRCAAGRGDVGAVAGFFQGDRLRAEAGDARQFYRPHDEFPDWPAGPTDDEQEILDEALIWAVRCDRLAVAQVLLDRGARVDGQVYTGNALHGAAQRGRVAALAWLLDRGADPDARGRWPAGATALHLAASAARLDVVRLLLDRGADPNLLDEEFGCDPAGYAEWAGARDVQELLLAAQRG